MKILKKLFGGDTKIHVDEIVFDHNSVYKGINNGLIVETGSNANGRWTKFGDGTLIQYCSKVVAPAPNVQSGAIWRSPSVDIPYPIAFATTQTPAISVNVDSDTGFCWAGLGDKAAGSHLVSVAIFSASANKNTSKVSVIAIGRWK